MAGDILIIMIIITQALGIGAITDIILTGAEDIIMGITMDSTTVTGMEVEDTIIHIIVITEEFIIGLIMLGELLAHVL